MHTQPWFVRRTVNTAYFIPTWYWVLQIVAWVTLTIPLSVAAILVYVLYNLVS